MVREGDNKLGRCKTCQATYKCSSGSTTPLLNHIKSKHQESYLEFRQKRPRVLKSNNTLNESESGVNDDLMMNQVQEHEFSFDPLLSEESENVSIKQENASISDKLVLSGEDFPSDVVNIFRELANDVEFTNVTLVTDGGTNIKAHKPTIMQLN